MHEPYDAHSYSRHYREEVFRAAKVRDLGRPAGPPGEERASGARTARVWTGMLALLGRTKPAG